MPAPTTISAAAQDRLAAGPFVPELPAADDLDGWRELVERENASTAERFPLSDFPARVEDRDIDGVTVYSSRPEGVASDALYVWFHPGAMVVGGGAACRATTARTSVLMQLETWGVDYRMPPFHRFPAGLDDAMAVYRAALMQRDPSRLFVGGDSAGGNLVAAMLLRAKDEGLPMPAALILNTPQVDLTESGDTFRTLAGVSNIGSARETIALYAPGAELTDPLLSPVLGGLAGFPGTFLQSGTRDLLLSNTVRMHRALRTAGVEADLHVFEAMPHGGFGGNTPEDQEHQAEQRRFLARHGAYAEVAATR